MATVVADADVVVHADLSGFARELRRKITPIVKSIQTKVDVAADTSEAKQDVRNLKREIERGRKAQIKVEAQFDRDVQQGFVGIFAKLGDTASGLFSNSFTRGLSDLSGIGGSLGKDLSAGLAGLAQGGIAAVAAVAVLVPAIVGLGLVLGALVGAAGAAGAALVALAPGVIGPAVLAVGALTLGFQGFDKVLSSIMSGKLTDFEKALEGLSPAARDFVDNLRPLVGIGDEIQQRLFAGLADRVGPALEQVGTKARDAFGRIADVANLVIGNLFEQLSSPKNIAALGQVADATVSIFQSLGDAVRPVIQGIVDSMSAAAPGIKRIGQTLGRVLASIGQSFSNLAANGTIDRIATAFDNLLAAAGPALVRVFEELASAAPSVLEAFIPLLESVPLLAAVFADLAKSGILTQLFTVLRDTLIAIGPQIPFIAQSFTQFLVAITPLIPPLTQLILLLSAGIFTEFALLLSGITFALIGLTVAFGTAQAALNVLVFAFQAADSTIRSVWSSVWAFVVNTVTAGANAVVATMAALPGRISGVLSTLAGLLGGIGRAAMSSLASAFAASANVIASVRAVGAGIQANIRGIVGGLFTIGINAMTSLASGLATAGKGAIKTAKSIASSVLSAVGGILRIGSPSKVMIQYGQWLSEGLAIGISRSIGDPISAAERLASGTAGGFRVPAFGDGGLVSKPTLAMVGEKGPELIIPTQNMSGNGSSTTINRTMSPTINVHAAGADPEAVANRVLRRLVAVGA